MFELITILALFLLCVLAVFLWQREVGKLYEEIDKQDEIIFELERQNYILRGQCLTEQADEFAKDCK